MKYDAEIENVKSLRSIAMSLQALVVLASDEDDEEFLKIGPLDG